MIPIRSWSPRGHGHQCLNLDIFLEKLPKSRCRVIEQRSPYTVDIAILVLNVTVKAKVAIPNIHINCAVRPVGLWSGDWRLKRCTGDGRSGMTSIRRQASHRRPCQKPPSRFVGAAASIFCCHDDHNAADLLLRPIPVLFNSFVVSQVVV